MEEDDKGVVWAERTSKPRESVPGANTHSLRFRFTGKGGEYFGIVFVNNFLNMITLWFYSPWAKIRSLRYLYGNTSLAGSVFEFTANPWRMLRSRVIAVALLILFVVSDFLSEGDNRAATYVYFGLLALYFLLAPVLAVFVLSFRFRYSQWRAIAFGFNKDFRQAYRVYMLPLFSLALVIGGLSLPALHEEIGEALGMELSVEVPLEEPVETPATEESSSESEGLPAEVQEPPVEEGPFYEPHPSLWIPAGIALLIFLLALPYFDFISMRFVVTNVRLGTARLLFLAQARDFYGIYLRYLLWIILPLVGLPALLIYSGLAASVGLLFVFGFVLVYPLTLAYFKSQRYNIMLNSAQFIDYRHRLLADVPVAGMLWVSVTNTLAIILSFGLLIPWATVRTVRFMLKHTELLVVGSLDDFAAAVDREADPLGEELADVFDLDLIG